MTKRKYDEKTSNIPQNPKPGLDSGAHVQEEKHGFKLVLGYVTIEENELIKATT